MPKETAKSAPNSAALAREVLERQFHGYSKEVIAALVASGGKRADAIKSITHMLGNDKDAAERAVNRAQEILKQAGVRDAVRSKWLDRVGNLVPWPIRKLGSWMWRNKVTIGVTALALGAGGYAAYYYWDKIVAVMAKFGLDLTHLKGKAMEYAARVQNLGGKAQELGGAALEKGKELGQQGMDALGMSGPGSDALIKDGADRAATGIAEAIKPVGGPSTMVDPFGNIN